MYLIVFLDVGYFAAFSKFQVLVPKIREKQLSRPTDIISAAYAHKVVRAKQNNTGLELKVD